jgi:hypothetical protein
MGAGLVRLDLHSGLGIWEHFLYNKVAEESILTSNIQTCIDSQYEQVEPKMVYQTRMMDHHTGEKIQ